MANTSKPVALVTGGNRGLGLAIAGQLAERGMRVIISARRPEQGFAAAEQLRGAGADVDWLELDVTSASHCRQAVDDLLQREGRLDVLVNNAGVALDQWMSTQQLDVDVLRQTMEVNLYAPLRLSQLVLPHMRERGYGRIVNMSTELASISESDQGTTAAYRCSKTALNMLTKLLSLELKDDPNILVNAAAPGWVKTQLGGKDAPRTPVEGAQTPVWLATLPEGGPSGGFFRDEKPYPW